MTQPHTDLLEVVLRDCDRQAPWYPAEFAKATGLPPAVLEACLGQLKSHGLLCPNTSDEARGLGYQLTKYGLEVLEQPRLLGRLRSGDIPTASNDGAEPAAERQAVADQRGEKIPRRPGHGPKAWATRILAALNVLWFLVGIAGFYAALRGQGSDLYRCGP